MNIYALKGHQVKVTSNSGDWGRASDQAQVKRLLKWQQSYTVDYTRVGSTSTRIALEEFPGEEFNSVNFEDVFELDTSKDFLHPDWVMWNRELNAEEQKEVTKLG